MMDQLNQAIEGQYSLPGLLEDILERLADLGIHRDNIRRADLSSIDEFHVRGAEVSNELVAEFDLEGLKLLDVGCGLGGPCRMLADEFNCQVFGIDMSHEFIRTANKLSEWLGLDEKTDFVCGDALNLPYADDSFDVVWTQHVQMNIEDKRRFYAEIDRVLDGKGVFIYYDIFRRGFEDVKYPVPWADDNCISYLQTVANMDSILRSLGFIREQKTDQTAKGIDFFEELLEKNQRTGLPKLGLHLLLGKSTTEKLGNLLDGLKDNTVELESGMYRKK